MKISPDMPLNELQQLMDKSASLAEAEALRSYLVRVGWEATEAIPPDLWSDVLAVANILFRHLG